MRPEDIRHVGVVGAGLMGSGIVEVCARAGLRVTFIEGSDELVAAGRGRVERSVAKAVERGKLDPAAAGDLLGRIDAATDLGALGDVDLVIEAATEDREAKAGIFAELGRRTRAEVVLASNTSSIPIRELGAASARPGDVIGMHFFNPPPVMALLELTPSTQTSEETYELVRAFGTDVLGKTCVRSGDQAGFIVNRLLIPYLFDAIRLYASGFASREDIDTAMRLGLAHPMGPLTLSDLIGLDTLLAIGEVLREAFPEDPRYEAPALLRDLVARGSWGRRPAAASTTTEVPVTGRPPHTRSPRGLRSRHVRSQARDRGDPPRGARCSHRRCGTRSSRTGRTTPCGRRGRAARSDPSRVPPGARRRAPLRLECRDGLVQGRGPGVPGGAHRAQARGVNGRRRGR